MDASQKVAEQYIKRDESDTRNCAHASLEFIRTISNRDKALTGKKK